MAYLVAADLQYVLNKISMDGYAKAFGQDKSFFAHLPLVKAKAGASAIEAKYHYGKNSSPNSFSESDDINTPSRQQRRKISFAFKTVGFVFGAAGLQRAIAANLGVDGLSNDIVYDEMKDGMEDMFEELNTQLLGDGTGNSSKDLQGVQYHIADAGNYGVEALDRATYTWLASLVHDAVSDRALSKELMQALYTAMVDDRSAMPTEIWTTSTVKNAYTDLFANNVRFIDIVSNVADIAIRKPAFEEIPIFAFPGYAAKRLDMVKKTDWEIQYLPQAVTTDSGERNEGIWKVEKVPQTTDALVYRAIAYVNLVCKNAYKQGSLQDLI